MALQHLLNQANALIEIVQDSYWSHATIEGYGFLWDGYGHETHRTHGMRLTSNARQEGILLYYKTTTTPRYRAGDKQWNIGQVEADQWERYMRLIGEGNKMALLIYCSYHSRPLLCDYPIQNWVVADRRRVMSTTRGSGTDYCNIDLTKLRTFGRFMADEFGVPEAVSNPLIGSVLEQAKGNPLLQTTHHERSDMHGREDRRTGFNWENCPN